MKSTTVRPGVRLLLTLLCDLLALGVCLVVFALFHHVLPDHIDPQILDQDPASVIDRPSGDADETPEARADRLTEACKRYKSSPFPARTVSILPGYDGDGEQIRLRKVEYGTGSEKVTYYAADIFVDSVSKIHASVATKNGDLTTDYVYAQALEKHALFAVSGDYFKNSEVGLAIRDGVLYRNVTTKNDVCLLNMDGSLEILEGYDETQLGTLGRRVWQSWSFGPSLLTKDGAVKTKNKQFNVHSTGGTFHNTNEESENGVYAKNPRCFIGCVEPGHYLLVVVDGRDEGYSCGVTFLEESQLAYDEGCEVAYNLDGGRSAMMVYRLLPTDDPTKMVNESYKDGRPISDIIYLLKLDKPDDPSDE